MDDNDDEFGIDEEDLLMAASLKPFPPSNRPVKKRRLNTDNSAKTKRTSTSIESSSNSYSDSDLTEPDLPLNRKKPTISNNSFEQKNPERQQVKKNKRRIAIPDLEDAEIPPDEFVTQLTQPASSPSHIRGARWKRRVPPPQDDDSEHDHVSRPRSTDDDDNIDSHVINQAKPYATFNKYEPSGENVADHAEESLFCTQSPPEEEDPTETYLAELADLPHDAFESSPATARQDAIIISSQPAISNTGPLQSNQPKTYRQTTLFGDTAAAEDSSTQTRGTHAWPLASKQEAPTHHNLDEEATRTWVYPMNIGAIRDYQFNIVSRGLFHNLLVALPTGLGKTFIAATIMLNWFRWTKDAQIIFVAPTKPLVSQQVDACFQTVGIPKSETTMLTGDISPGLRAEEWQSKRVFFMTPQTFVNDLKTGICDPKRIVLFVVDEAHRATGAYAYVEAVSFLRRFNSSFRVLALTATPGPTVEKVQEVIDGLDIARTEIRTEESLDIRSYVHTKNVDLKIFDHTEEMELVMDLCSRAIKPVLTLLNTQNAYWSKDPMSLTPFGLNQAKVQWLASAGRNLSWNQKGPVVAIFATLASIAHSIELLLFHGLVPFFHKMVELRNATHSAGEKGSKYKKQIVDNEHFKKMMTMLGAWTANENFVCHPKLEYVRSAILDHFVDAGEGRGAAHDRGPSETRIMVFVHYRDSAEEVVRILKKHEPMIRPHIFNGQAATKTGEGMDQKTQLATIEAFKKGTYNTLVATSIGEEGLDIGEVDLILCYDSSSSPIRMLQRMGRTGRKRQGNVVVLLMRGKEEDNLFKAKDNYVKIQQTIEAGTRFTYHDDRSPRILPKEIQPIVDKRVIEIPLENTQPGLPEPRAKKRGKVPKRPPKKFHMPDNVETGFVKASRFNKGDDDDSQNEIDDESRRKPTPASRRMRKPSPEAVEMPPLEEVLLTESQEKRLLRKYADLHDAPSELIEPPKLDNYPSLLRTLQPTKYVRHGRFAKTWATTFQKIHDQQNDCEDKLRQNLRMEDLWGHIPTEFEDDKGGETSLSEAQANVGRKASKSSRPKQDGARDMLMTASQASDTSLGLSQLFDAKGEVEAPFYVSQKSWDGMNDGKDDDLPDLNALLHRGALRDEGSDKGKENIEAEKPLGRKKRPFRFILDDDSDE